MIKKFTDDAWDDYTYWQGQDKKTLKRINLLIKDIDRDPFNGIGKPEALKGNLSGWWSRRINHTDRIIYRLEENKEEVQHMVIASLRGHY